jgi:hypothetical protein
MTCKHKWTLRAVAGGTAKVCTACGLSVRVEAQIRVNRATRH